MTTHPCSPSAAQPRERADDTAAREHLPPQQRLYGIMTNMQRVQVTLTDARYHGSPTARDTAAEIETFAQLGARTALPE